MRLIDADMLCLEWAGAVGNYSVRDILSSIDDAETIIPEMSAVEYERISQRFSDWCAGTLCSECSFYDDCPQSLPEVIRGLTPEQRVAAMQKWAQEHPPRRQTMSEKYLKHEDVLRAICHDCCCYDHGEECCGDGGTCEDYDAICRISPADVKPVVYARWEERAHGGIITKYTIFRCTNCNHLFKVYEDTLNAGRGNMRFCPNCGADMRERSEE